MSVGKGVPVVVATRVDLGTVLLIRPRQCSIVPVGKASRTLLCRLGVHTPVIDTGAERWFISS